LPPNAPPTSLGRTTSSTVACTRAPSEVTLRHHIIPHRGLVALGHAERRSPPLVPFR
jgi:hypothetical protein